jgi:trimeric autotransporter adhesin
MTSIGSATSFWQQDQNYWSQVQQTDQTQTASDSLITDMGTLMTNQVKGLASIATQEALTRTNNQLTAALKSAIAQTTGSASSSSNGSSNTPAPATPSEATGTGTVPLLATTPLMALGIPPNSGISVSDGTYTTTYNTTGTDTVGDLINAINNTIQPNNAQVNAYLNTSGNLVISALNNTNSISITGLFTQNVGFGSSNDSFSPPPSSSNASTSTTGASTSSSTSSSSTTNSSSSTSSSSGTAASSSTGKTSTGTSSSGLLNSALAIQTGGTAVTLLSSGVGSTIDLFA